MTISNTKTKIILDSTGITRDWQYDFPIENEDNIKIYLTDLDGVVSLQETDYSVNLLTLTVTYPTVISGLPLLPDGWKLTIARVLPIVQTTSYKNQGEFPSEAIEESLDELAKTNQQQQEQIDRSIKLAIDQTEEEGIAEYINEMNVIKEDTEEFKDEAETARDDAQTAQANAETAETNAVAAKDDAVAAKDDAEGFADEAEGFADEAEDYLNSATGISGWIDTKTYTVGQVCLHNGVVYSAIDIVGNLNQEPPNATYWVVGFINWDHSHNEVDSGKLATLNTNTGHTHNGINSKALNGRANTVPLLATSLNLTYEKLYITKTIAVGNNPQGITFDGTDIWVVNTSDDTVNRIDKDDNIIATIPVGEDPTGIVFDGINIWVANDSDNTVSRIARSTNTVIAVINVAGAVSELVFANNYIWGWSVNNTTISQIDRTTNAVIDTIIVSNNLGSGIYDGEYLWISTPYNNNVYVIDIIAKNIFNTIAVGNFPDSIAFDGKNIWIVNIDSNNISKINIITQTVVSTLSIDGSTIFFDGKYIYITQGNFPYDRIYIVDIFRDDIVDTILNVNSGHLSFDGEYLLVLKPTLDNILKIKI